MKKRARLRGPNGQFTRNLNGDTPAVLRHWTQLLVACGLALALALLLAHCHMVWAGGDVTMPIELPRDLLSPLE